MFEVGGLYVNTVQDQICIVSYRTMSYDIVRVSSDTVFVCMQLNVGQIIAILMGKDVNGQPIEVPIFNDSFWEKVT